jgi:hypothetical protein
VVDVPDFSDIGKRLPGYVEALEWMRRAVVVIYDINIDATRPVTQEDIDTMVRTNAAFGLLLRYLRGTEDARNVNAAEVALRVAQGDSDTTEGARDLQRLLDEAAG